MHGRSIRSIAALCAASLIAHPLMVTPGAQASPALDAAAYPSNQIIASPVMLVPVTALPAASLETQRSAIAQIMIELGEDEDRAQQMASELTADDLAVLLANPKMMQKAGDIVLIICAVIVVGVIVALVIAADSSTVIIT